MKVQKSALALRGSLGLKKAAAWLHRHPLAIELLTLAGVICLFVMEVRQ